MKYLTILAFLISVDLATSAESVLSALHPDEAKIIQSMMDLEAGEVQASEVPGWAKGGILKSLEEYGVDAKSVQSSLIASKASPNRVLSLFWNSDGRVVALGGNGPWLRNSTLRSFKGLPELRIVGMDHNGFVGNDPRIPEFDGSGFDALKDSKLAEIKIGLSFSDKGMEQCAKIKTLRSFSVGHSQASEAGIAFFAGHPGLTSFSISEMASPRVTEKALAAIAKIPNLTHVGLMECYVTYDGGFIHLAPFKGKLVQINLGMSAATQADLDKLQADHPGAKIITTPLAEIPKRHIGVAMNLVKQLPPELAATLNTAIEEFRKK